MLRAPVSAVRKTITIGAIGLMVWLGATMGVTVVTGNLPAVLVEALPMLDTLPAMPAALGLFTIGAVLIVLALYAGLALTGRRRAP
jgi:hypothetical protein